MDNEFLKFIVDLGSIGAICFVVWSDSRERIATHTKFIETIQKMTDERQKNQNEQ